MDFFIYDNIGWKDERKIVDLEIPAWFKLSIATDTIQIKV